MSVKTMTRECIGNATVETSATVTTTIRVRSGAAAGEFEDGPVDPAII